MEMRWDGSEVRWGKVRKRLSERRKVEMRCDELEDF